MTTPHGPVDERIEVVWPPVGGKIKPVRVGEGAIWDPRTKKLVWIDVPFCKVFVYDPATNENRTIDVRQAIGTIVLCRDNENEAVAALAKGLAVVDLKEGKITKWICHCEPGLEHAGNRYNDGKCDSQGRLWVGTMAYFLEPGKGSLYKVDTDGSYETMISNATCPNGIVWSGDGKTMYWIDSFASTVRAYPFDAEKGTIGEGTVVIEIPTEHGYPDGCAIDADGNIWIALWEGWAVRCYDPRTGKELHKIGVDGKRVTSVAFGGDNLEDLYITTASVEISDEDKEKHPHTGRLLRIRNVGVKGVEPEYFGSK